MQRNWYWMLPELTAKNATFVLYADNTSILVTNPRPEEFTTNLYNVFTDVYWWFTRILLSLSLNKKLIYNF